MTAEATVINTELRDGFDQVAPRYDLMVGLNPGYHRHLRSAADALVDRLRSRSSGDRFRDRAGGCELRLVDLGCGSGASTRALVDAAGPDTRIVGVDASSGMLDQARAKRWPSGVRLHHGQAEDVALRRTYWDLAEPQDGVFAAYLFRNVADRDHALEAVAEVLRPGGWLVSQEYSVAGNVAARRIFTAVCWLVVIPLSFLTSGQTALYRYLWRSVLDFDSVQGFVDRLSAAGFVDIEVRTVPGWQRGILHTFRARRPVLPGEETSGPYGD